MVKTIKQIDINNDKNISFTEFLIAGSNKQTLLAESNLLSAFSYIDNDKDEFITREDLRIFLNIKNEYFIGNIIEEADDDCDGGLLYKEFAALMQKILKYI